MIDFIWQLAAGRLCGAVNSLHTTPHTTQKYFQINRNHSKINEETVSVSVYAIQYVRSFNNIFLKNYGIAGLDCATVKDLL